MELYEVNVNNICNYVIKYSTTNALAIYAIKQCNSLILRKKMMESASTTTHIVNSINIGPQRNQTLDR